MRDKRRQREGGWKFGVLNQERATARFVRETRSSRTEGGSGVGKLGDLRNERIAISRRLDALGDRRWGKCRSPRHISRGGVAVQVTLDRKALREFAGDPFARDRRIRDCCQAFARHAVDDIEGAEAPTVRCRKAVRAILFAFSWRRRLAQCIHHEYSKTQTSCSNKNTRSLFTGWGESEIPTNYSV